MKSFLVSLIALTASIGVRGATSDSIDWSAHQWQAPLPTDSRAGFNHEPTSLIRTAGKLGLLTTDNTDHFALEELALHGTIEHDASFSRSDLAIGDNIHFNATVVATLKNSNPGVDYYNITSAAQVMVQRLAEDSLINPNLTNTIKEFSARVGKSGLYLGVIGNITTGVAPKKFVQIFFEQERLPLEEGWHCSDVPIDDDNFNKLTNAITQAVTEWAPSGPIVCPWVRLQPEGPVTLVPLVVGTDHPGADNS